MTTDHETCWTGDVTSGEQPLATLTPLRGIPLKAAKKRRPAHRAEEPALWFVTITVSGERMRAEDVRAGLERLSELDPFLVSAAYASSRAELRYWDESVNIEGAVESALRLWNDNLEAAGLPPWRVVGLEVFDRDTARRRRFEPPRVEVAELGEIRPMAEGDY